MNRRQLPHRRISHNITVEWQGHTFDVTYGLHTDGRVGDLFADCRKSGQMRADIRASATMASLAIQNGATLDDLLSPLERVQEIQDGKGVEFYASPIGEIIAQIVRHQSEQLNEASNG